MPVRKYHSVEEMPSSLTGEAGLEGLRQALALTRIARGLRPWRLPAGVHKHRSADAGRHWRETAAGQPVDPELRLP